MVFAFTGAHRAGKSTLAKRVAEDLGIEFYETKSGDVLKQAGINLVGNMDLKQRMIAQELLLDHHLNMLKELPRPLIVDRCPIDMFAYTVGEVAMHSVKDPELDAQIQRYLDRCLHMMEMHYAVAIICPPLPAYDAQDGKPPPSRTYQTHIHHLISGACENLEHVTYGTLTSADFDERHSASCEIICDTMNEMAQQKEQFWVN